MLWPIDQRPKSLRSKDTVNAFKIEDLLALYRFSKESEKAEKDDNEDSSLKEGVQPTVTFKEVKDDRQKLLAPASFIRLPIKKYRYWYKNVPVKRRPFVKPADLAFTGTDNAVTDITLKRMHNRQNAMQIKHFYNGNLNVSTKKTEVKTVTETGQVETSFDFAWTNPTNVHQLQEAMITYACCLHPLYPTDPTGLIMFRVLITFRWLAHVDEHNRAKIIIAFIQDVLRQNASRAVNHEVILSYEEQMKVMKKMLTVNNVRPDIPIGEGKNVANAHSTAAGRQRESGDKSKAKSKSNDKRHASFKSKTGAVLGVCYGYNDSGSRPCTNPPFGDGCKRADGQMFAHVCNVFIQAQDKHCLGKHPRRQHR